MEKRLGVVEPIDIVDGVINIYVNYLMAYSPAAFHLVPLTRRGNGVITPSLEFDCGHHQMKRYRAMCSKTPACDSAIGAGSEYADTVCGTCYKYNNPDNPIYEVSVGGIAQSVKQMAADFAKRSLVYMVRRMKLAHITHYESFRDLMKGIYVLGDMIAEQLANTLEGAIRIYDLRDALKDGTPKRRLEDLRRSIVFKNQMYEIVSEQVSRSDLIIAQLNSINASYSDLFLRARTDDPGSEPRMVSSVDTLPWTARDHVFGKKLADDYWDKLDIAKMVAEISLAYPATEGIIEQGGSIFGGEIMPLIKVLLLCLLAHYAVGGISVTKTESGQRTFVVGRRPSLILVASLLLVAHYLLAKKE